MGIADIAGKLQRGCKQLSQLEAWMWVDENIIQHDDENDVKILKTLFDAVLKYQAFKDNIIGSDAIAKILQGDNQGALDELAKDEKLGIDTKIPTAPSLKIPDVYSKLVPPETDGYNRYVFTEPDDPKFLDSFYAQVVRDRFDGTVYYDFFGTKNPTNEPKFIVVIPYPPKPELSDFTITEDELKTWARTKEKAQYEPPNFNPYIPVNGST